MKIGIENDFWTAEYYEATVVSANDYYPFGSAMAGRKYNQGSYRYGFNGMEKDDEMKGEGNSYDFGARMYDSRIGRWLAVDPLEKKYPNLSPYNFVGNNPITATDPDGKKIKVIGDFGFKLRIAGYLTVMRIFGDKELRCIVKEVMRNEIVINVDQNAVTEEGDFRPGTITDKPVSPSFDYQHSNIATIHMWPTLELHRAMVFPTTPIDGIYQFIKETEYSIFANELSHAYDYIVIGATIEAMKNMIGEDKSTMSNKHTWPKDISISVNKYKPELNEYMPNDEYIQNYEMRSNIIENKARSIFMLPLLINESHVASHYLRTINDANNFIVLMEILQQENITEDKMQEAQKIFNSSKAIQNEFKRWDMLIEFNYTPTIEEEHPQSMEEAKPDID